MQRVYSRGRPREMLAIFLSSAALSAAVKLEPCAADEAQHLDLSRLTLWPDSVLPGEQLCATFDAKPDVPVRRGSRVRVEMPGALGGVVSEYDLCGTRGVKCPGDAANVSGTICDQIPLTAMLLAGSRVDFTIRATDESGAPLACWKGAVAVADGISIDADVESMADDAAHHPLRRALMTAEDARSGGGAWVDDARTKGIRRLLKEAYEASPDWAEAFTRWRDLHGRRNLQHAPESLAALIAEANSFVRFRENTLSAHRSGRGLSIDARSDQAPDARRTLGHFG